MLGKLDTNDNKDAAYTLLRAIKDAGPRSYQPTGSLRRLEYLPSMEVALLGSDRVPTEMEGGIVASMADLRGEERWVKACIEAMLRDAEVKQHDDGSKPGMHDLDLIDPTSPLLM
ncbi:hypothetical protein [Micromonospora sp. WMMD708]|uniref:hypothetical protein n=1 Tax=Micromonospora sp. WMMD708 TaxID=3403464 RepID=UPI003BF52F84